MTRRHFLTASGLAAGTAMVAQQVVQLERVPNGQLVLAFAGRFNLDADRNGQIVAYATLLHGFPSAGLFNGPASEASARITIVSTPARLEIFRVGPLIHARPNPVSGDAIRLRVYYDELAGNQDPSRADTFSNGRLVAVLRARPYSFTSVPLLMAHAEAVLDLESSEDFLFSGQRVNFRQLAQAVQVNIHGGPVPGGRSQDPFLSFPLSGTGFAADPFPPRAQ